MSTIYTLYNILYNIQVLILELFEKQNEKDFLYLWKHTLKNDRLPLQIKRVSLIELHIRDERSKHNYR